MFFNPDVPRPLSILASLHTLSSYHLCTQAEIRDEALNDIQFYILLFKLLQALCKRRIGLHNFVLHAKKYHIKASDTFT